MRLFCVSRYQSSLGSWRPGMEVDVPDSVADLLLRDSPGSFSFDPPAPQRKPEAAADEVERAPLPGVEGALGRPQRKGQTR